MVNVDPAAMAHLTRQDRCGAAATAEQSCAGHVGFDEDELLGASASDFRLNSAATDEDELLVQAMQEFEEDQVLSSAITAYELGLELNHKD